MTARSCTKCGGESHLDAMLLYKKSCHLSSALVIPKPKGEEKLIHTAPG